MSNLGRYEELVVQAKQSGGVDKLVAEIGAAAVKRSTPSRVGVGIGIGVGLALAAKGAVDWYKKAGTAGRNAEDELRRTLAEAEPTQDGPRAETDPDAFPSSSPSGEGTQALQEG